MKHFLQLAILAMLFVGCASNEPSESEKKADIYYANGTMLLMEKDYTGALDNLLNAYALRPKDSKICNNLGMAYFFKKTNSMAIQHLKESIELDSKNTDAKVNLASVYMETGKLDEAKTIYKDVLEDLVYKKQQRTYYNLGVLELKRNNQKTALQYLQKSIDVDDTYCPAHYQIGLLAFEKNNYKLAVKKFKEAAIGVCYNNPEPHWYQALSYSGMNDVESAKMKLEEILERFHRTKYYNMAQAKLLELQNQPTSDQNSMDAAVLKHRYRKISSPTF